MTLRRTGTVPSPTPDAHVDEETRSRVDRYVQALESSDVDAIAALVAHEAA